MHTANDGEAGIIWCGKVQNKMTGKKEEHYARDYKFEQRLVL